MTNDKQYLEIKLSYHIPTSHTILILFSAFQKKIVFITFNIIIMPKNRVKN